MRNKVAIIWILIMLNLMGIQVCAKERKEEPVISDSFLLEVKDTGDTKVKEQEIYIEEDGSYRFYGSWKADAEGVLTGCVIYDSMGKPVFACTGEEVYVGSRKLKLTKGTYRLEFHLLGSQQEYEVFMEKNETEPETEEDEWYDFAPEHVSAVVVSYHLEECQEHSIWYVLGVLAGIAFGLLLFVLMKIVIHLAGGKVQLKWDRKCDGFDERQKLARGVAYKWGFFTILIYVMVVSLLNDFGITGMFMSFGGLLIGICLSLFVFVVICILKDAYMSLYENVRGVVMMLSFVAAVNLICGTRTLAEQRPLLEDGTLSLGWANISIGTLFILTTIVFGVKAVYNNRQLEDED